MEMRINEVLDNVITRLQKETRDPRIGQELAYEVKSFNREYQKTIAEIQQCQKVRENLHKIVDAFIPQGEKLAKTVWQTFESYGLWSPQTESITDLMEKTLTPKRFIEDAIDAILVGCDCRKR